MRARWIVSLILITYGGGALGAALKPIKLHPDYVHDRWGTNPTDILKHFRA